MMNDPEKRALDAAALRGLGERRSVQAACAAAGMPREEFAGWWHDQLRRRLPALEGHLAGAVSARVTITRDRWGIPHISATDDRDLFFGYGFAMAQDRLFQMDHQRRLGLGRLAEIMGAAAVPSDRVARIVGFAGIAERELAGLDDETVALLDAFAAGVNAGIDQMADLPVEFGLLGYAPEPWRPSDSLACLTAFRWYLTGRLPVIAIPELLKRELGSTGLYRFLLDTERGADDEIIVPGPASGGSAAEASGWTAPDPDQGLGSNNWGIAGSRTASGVPLVASDPHLVFTAVSNWYEVRLSGGTFDVGGIGHIGVPGMMIGRNRSVAWSVTNNLCSQRDLYREEEDATRPGWFRWGSSWEAATTARERITVRGGDDVEVDISATRNGPVVDALLADVLPGVPLGPGPIALRWMGTERCDFAAAMLRLARVDCERDVARAVAGWLVPTFNLITADVHGHLGYLATGALPIRDVPERGFRPGWTPEHQWTARIPTEAMPRWVDPERGWLASANNRTAPESFPYHLAGTWDQPYRARRIREMIESRARLDLGSCQEMQLDVTSLRARECRAAMMAALEACDSADGLAAAAALATWDLRVTADSVAAPVFELFFARWMSRVAAERFEDALAPTVMTALRGTSTALLHGDPVGWFSPGGREAALLECARGTLEDLRERLGGDPRTWTWGRIHQLHLRHVLSDGDLAGLLDSPGVPIPGDNATVCNTGLGPQLEAAVGATYRFIADLAADPPAYLSIDAHGQSGNPGSPNYGDQQPDWLAGSYRTVSWDGAAEPRSALVIEPLIE